MANPWRDMTFLLAIRARRSCRRRRTGTIYRRSCRSWRRSEPVDAAQDVGEQVTRHGYLGLKADQPKRLKALEKENERLRRAVSDLTLDKMILTEAARGNF